MLVHVILLLVNAPIQPNQTGHFATMDSNVPTVTNALLAPVLVNQFQVLTVSSGPINLVPVAVLQIKVLQFAVSHQHTKKPETSRPTHCIRVSCRVGKLQAYTQRSSEYF